MRRLAWGQSFRRAFKRRTRNNPSLQHQIVDALERLAKNPFDPSLKSHKLTGKLHGLWACWVQYDCRIIYAFEHDQQSREEIIVLVDVGTHDEVY